MSVLCKDCGIFTSKQIIDEYENKIMLLEREISDLKAKNIVLNGIKQTNEELMIVNKHLLSNINIKPKKSFFNLF